ncbi:CehA/McbA family metallohydrolase [Paenibacillus sp. IITD108]|uniref:CehA/McbA family metallohydrolase n=1 Tax=Paenibacillus sp. IITD108 TaxID=3116649 RepID=UPI002F41109B
MSGHEGMEATKRYNESSNSNWSRIEINRVIKQEEQRAYYIELPFEVPEQTEMIHVSMEYTPLGEGAVTIDLGICSPERVRGWSGGARKEFYVGLEKATPGYLPGPLNKGIWHILLGAYRIPNAGCEVKVHIRCEHMVKRWLKGDLHSHTQHSDGTYTLQEAGEIMEQLGCDFIATTDHNTVSQNFAHPKESSLVFIPGIELTTNRGHINFLGVADPVKDFRVRQSEDMAEHIQAAKEQEAKVVLNHPHCEYCPWEWGFEHDYDWVEVWNGPWTERNQRALDWWQEQLASGRRLVAVGGSDVHRPHIYMKHAMPTTWVYSESRTIHGILQGIGQGHVFLSYSPDGPIIEHTIGSFMIGDCIEGEEGEQRKEPAKGQVKEQAQEKVNEQSKEQLTEQLNEQTREQVNEQSEKQLASQLDVPVNDTCRNPSAVVSNLTLSNVMAGDQIKIISDVGVEEVVEVVVSGELHYSWELENRKFYRIEVWRYFDEVKLTLLAAMSNPIYLRNMEH